MKIYFNRQPVSGPWGGGNKIVQTLSSALQNAGHEVVYSLDTSDIDVIYCQDPRPNHNGEKYDHFLHYREAFGAKIVHRIGDVGTHGKPELTDFLTKFCHFSDYLIFPSIWAKEHINFKGENYSIIENAPLDEFYKYRNFKKDHSDISIITHHWSTNPKKGFEYYKKLDEYIEDNPNLSFTYMGRLPNDLKLNNTNVVQPTGDNDRIAKQLSLNIVYLTASEEEAGANHVLEAQAAGLPVVYHSNGGSINEYVAERGKQFNNFDSMIQSITEISDNYTTYKDRVDKYSNNILSVSKKYLEIICDKH